MVDQIFLKCIYVTGYHKFISDHKTIVFRFGGQLNSLTNEVLEKITLNAGSHIRGESDADHLSNKQNKKKQRSDFTIQECKFRRRIENPDMANCWLNACLQLILTALDQTKSDLQFTSELGTELLHLMEIENNQSIDPTNVKQILVCAEDTRIALRKSEEMTKTQSKGELKKRLQNIERLHLNLNTGQQCVRDFFLCLHENVENWPDLYERFCLTTVNSTMCLTCKHKNESEQSQIYLEMEVPPDGSDMGEYVEEMINDSCIVQYHCQDGCQAHFQAEKRLMLKSANKSEFLIVLLRRSIMTENHVEIVKSTNNLLLRCVFHDLILD